MSLNRFTFFTIGFLLLCVLASTLSDIEATPPAAQAAPQRDPQTPTVTRSPVATSTPTPNVEITMLFLGATDTAIAIAKTEVELHALRETQAAKDLEVALVLTSQAQQTRDAATQQAVIGATHTQAAIAAANATATVAVTQTQGAQTAWANVTATQLAATQEIEQSALLAKQASILGGVVVLFLAMSIGLFWLGVVVWKSWALAKAEYIQTSAIVPDAQGRFPLPNTDALGKDNKVINPNLAHRAVIDPDHDDLTADQALANTQSQRALEAARALAQSPALMRQLLRKPAVTTETGMPNADMDIGKPAVPLLSEHSLQAPSWSLMENWDGKGPIPYGVSARGVERVDLRRNYHLGVFGMTGEGKSRYFLRPYIAGLLASGQRVIILGKSGDFWPFADHPNAKMITIRDLTDPNEAQRYANCLLSIVKEKNRRDEFLTAHRVSTWQEAGRETTFLVLDELGNAMDEMQSKSREETHRWVNALVKEGRKVGFNVVLASQRAVGFKSIVEQMGRVAFYLSDPEASRYAIGMPGAEQLPKGTGHFLAKFVTVNHCISFNPTDDELTRFLQERPVGQLEPIDWIEGEVVSASTPPAADDEAEIEQKIHTVLARMKRENNVNISQAQREVYGETDDRGGKHWKKIQQIWIEMQSGSATATQGKPDSGDLTGSDTGIALGSVA